MFIQQRQRLYETQGKFSHSMYAHEPILPDDNSLLYTSYVHTLTREGGRRSRRGGDITFNYINTI